MQEQRQVIFKRKKKEPKSIDSIIATFNQTVADLEAASSHHNSNHQKAIEEMNRQHAIAEKHATEVVRADRIAQKVRELVS